MSQVTTESVVSIPTVPSRYPNIGAACLAVWQVMLAILQSGGSDGDAPKGGWVQSIDGKLYLSGSRIFRELGIVKPDDKLIMRPLIEGVLNGTVEIPLPEGDEQLSRIIPKVLLAIRAKFPGWGVCFRPNFEWTKRVNRGGKARFGTGEDWPLLESRWIESATRNGGVPDPEWVATQYGSDEWGVIMTPEYALTRIREYNKDNPPGLPMPPDTGRGRRANVPSFASLGKLAKLADIESLADSILSDADKTE